MLEWFSNKFYFWIWFFLTHISGSCKASLPFSKAYIRINLVEFKFFVEKLWFEYGIQMLHNNNWYIFWCTFSSSFSDSIRTHRKHSCTVQLNVYVFRSDHPTLYYVNKKKDFVSLTFSFHFILWWSHLHNGFSWQCVLMQIFLVVPHFFLILILQRSKRSFTQEKSKWVCLFCQAINANEDRENEIHEYR